MRNVQELLTTIQSAAGGALAVDRRPKLNDRLLHRIARTNMTEIMEIRAREVLDSRGNPTGLDEIKRIKLVFRGDTSTSASNSRPSSSGNMMRNARRMTPPAAMGDDWRLLPHVSELHLDENTPPPEVRKRMRDENVMVVIPRKRINKALYPVFLARVMPGKRW